MHLKSIVFFLQNVLILWLQGCFINHLKVRFKSPLSINILKFISIWKQFQTIISSVLLVDYFLLEEWKWLGHIITEITPLKVAVAHATWCLNGICQSGERRRSRSLYTMAVQVSTILLRLLEAATTELAKVLDIILKWQWLVKYCLGLYLAYSCHMMCKGLLLLLSPLWQMILWHRVAHVSAILSDISFQCNVISKCCHIMQISCNGCCYEIYFWISVTSEITFVPAKQWSNP